VWLRKSEYSLPGLGGINVDRTWNSLWPTNNPGVTAGTFGDSWWSSVDERLEFRNNSNKRVWLANGNTLLFTYDSMSQGYILSAPVDEHASLAYNSSTALYTLTFKDGTKKIFNSAGRIFQNVDRNGITTSFNYDGSGRLSYIIDYPGRTLTFNYAAPQSPNVVSSIQDSTGTVASYTYDAGLHLTKATYADGSFIQYNYDANGLILSATDTDGKTLESHTYNPDGSRRGATSSRANGVDTVTISYPSPTSTRVQDTSGNFTDYAYSTVGSGQVRNYVTGVSGPGCATCGIRNNNTFGYDSGMNRNHVVDANGHVTDYVFDTLGNVLSKTQYQDAQTPVTYSYTYNSFGEVLTATDPLGVVTKNEYDAKGNLTCTSPDSASTTCSLATVKTKFTYNTLGELLTITDPRSNVTTLTYYTTGLINTIKDAQTKITTYNYDARGNRTSVIDPVNGSTKPTTFTYDTMNRLKKITYPDLTHSDFAYDHRGRRITVTDANTKVTTYGYDDADRLTQVTDAQTPNAGVTKYEYDNENNLSKITDALLRDTIFHYDALGHVTQTLFPSGFTEDYTYDQVGNLKTKTDRKRNLTTYNYDALDRLSSKVYNDSTEVDYAYDLDSRLKQVNGTAANGTYVLTYDNLGRLKQTDSTYAFLPAKTWTVKYTYDNASNRATMVDPQNGNTTYAYDTLNRLQTLTSPQGAFGFTYDALSRRLTLTRPNSITSSYTYDSLSHLLSVLHKKNNTQLDGTAYTYDNAGNRITKTDKRTTSAQTSLPLTATTTFTSSPRRPMARKHTHTISSAIGRARLAYLPIPTTIPTSSPPKRE
jgi:YD repeat-containing protein